MHRVIGERSLGETAVGPDLARAFLRDMVRARVFDERAVALQRRGWMSGYPPFRGQEASQVGAAHALADADWLFPTYRANAMQLTRGRPAADILRFRRGRSEFEPDPSGAESAGGDAPATDGERGGRTFTQATPIATHLPHAVGAAMAAGYELGDRADGSPADDGADSDAAVGDHEAEDGASGDRAVCAYFGDGATSEGDFHEALNFAGVFDAPAIFLCENNHWAISLPADRQTASETFAQKATAYGFEGVRVDGMDPIAVYETVVDARESALAGDPVLVESLTYRRGAHSTSDDPDRYRDDVDLPAWRTGDPIDRYVAFLREADVIEDAFIEDVREAASAAIDEAVAAAEATPAPDPEDVFAFAYETPPPRVEAQRRSVTSAVEENGE